MLRSPSSLSNASWIGNARSGPIARSSSMASRCFSQGPDDGTSSVSTGSSGTNTESPGW